MRQASKCLYRRAGVNVIRFAVTKRAFDFVVALVLLIFFSCSSSLPSLSKSGRRSRLLSLEVWVNRDALHRLQVPHNGCWHGWFEAQLMEQ